MNLIIRLLITFRLILRLRSWLIQTCYEATDRMVSCPFLSCGNRNTLHFPWVSDGLSLTFWVHWLWVSPLVFSFVTPRVFCAFHKAFTRMFLNSTVRSLWTPSWIPHAFAVASLFRKLHRAFPVRSAMCSPCVVQCATPCVPHRFLPTFPYISSLRVFPCDNLFVAL